MPKIYTNTAKTPVQPTPKIPSDACVTSYNDYAAQRTLEPAVFADLQTLTDSFKNRISNPIHVLNPDVEMGQYFVIPVKEITDMLNSCQNIEFIHVCNALRDTTNSKGENKTFPVTLLVPIIKTTVDGNPAYDVCQDANAKYIEAYPCPPDPRCPKSELVGTLLKPATKINDFNSLL